MRTPIDRLNACVNASVLLISSEKISEPAMVVNGVSSPRAWAKPMAMAVLPVPGLPARRIARPAICPAWIILYTIPHALRAAVCPTMPCEISLGSRASSKPRPTESPIIKLIQQSIFSCKIKGFTSNVRVRANSLHASQVPDFLGTQRYFRCLQRSQDENFTSDFNTACTLHNIPTYLLLFYGESNSTVMLLQALLERKLKLVQWDSRAM